METQPEREPINPTAAPSPPTPIPAHPEVDLKSVAEQEANIPLWKDFCYFLIQNKKWWLIPILLILLGLSLLMLLSSTAIAPFIYTVF